MRYDIIINLDYAGHPAEPLQNLFRQLQRAMQQAGFVMDGRRFSIDLPPEEAQELARKVLDRLERAYQREGDSLYPYIRECYGFEPEHLANLLLPPLDEIDVQELSDIEGVELLDLGRRG